MPPNRLLLTCPSTTSTALPAQAITSFHLKAWSEHAAPQPWNPSETRHPSGHNRPSTLLAGGPRPHYYRRWSSSSSSPSSLLSSCSSLSPTLFPSPPRSSRPPSWRWRGAGTLSTCCSSCWRSCSGSSPRKMMLMKKTPPRNCRIVAKQPLNWTAIGGSRPATQRFTILGWGRRRSERAGCGGTAARTRICAKNIPLKMVTIILM